MKKVIVTLFIIIGIFTLSFKTYPARADDYQQQLQQVQAEIDQLQKQLDDARGQEKTLKSELDYIDTQTKLTELKIEETTRQINQLNQQISDLSDRIDRLSTVVDSMTNVLLNRIVETYKFGNVSPIDLLFSSNGFSDLILRTKYIEVAQENDKKVLYQLQATKSTYHDQKTDRETREKQVEKLKADLVSYQKQLDSDKQVKAELLKVTQNNEAIYQAKIKTAQDEQNAILAILNGGGSEVSNGPIHKGDTIAHVIVGASACSTGTHLHFEVHQNDNLVNPAQLLSNHNVTFNNSPDSSFSFTGSWDLWPLNDPIYISQGFGNTWWAQHGWYTNPPGHTGIDMYRDPGDPSDVKAVHDGTLYTGTISCSGGTLHYKKVDHGDGYSSYYLHVL